jgi:membrane protein
LSRHEAFKSAAAIAFWLFLSLAPLLVFVGFLVGQVARHSGVDALLGPVLDVVPATSEAIVRDQLGRLAGRSAAHLAPLSVAGFLWTASSGVHNLMDLLEAMLGSSPRAYWKKRCLALGWVIAGLTAACALALALVRVDLAFRASEPIDASANVPAASATRVPSAAPTSREAESSRHLPARPRGASRRLRQPGGLSTAVGETIAASAMLLVGMLFLAGFYRFGAALPPHVHRRVWPGTIAAVACWLIVSWAFGEYVASVADYALFYGSLAAVAVLLVWLYLTSLSLIVGAEVNALLEGRRAPAVPKGKRAMSPV